MTFKKNQWNWLLEQKIQLLFWITVTLMLLLKIYQGSYPFFEEKFGHLVQNQDFYSWYKWLYHHFGTLVFFGIIPALVVKFVFKQNLVDYGLQIGDWRVGVKVTLIAMIVAIIPVYLSSKNPEHLAYYPLTDQAMKSPYYFFLWTLSYLPHYIGLEFFLRGFMGFELKKNHGVVVAVMVPVIIATLLHIGKPQGETWGAAFGAVFFSWITFRTSSILWPLLFHWYLGILNTYFCGIANGL
jgi:uncharacterized protein